MGSLSIDSFAIFNFVGLMLLLKYVHIAVSTLWMGAAFLDLIEPQSKMRRQLILVTATISLLTGVLHVVGYSNLSFYSSWGVSMLLGSALGFVMWLNLFVGISPAQKSGNEDRAKAIAFGNFAFAIPMLFFMETASHMGTDFKAESDKLVLISALALPIVLLEAYVLLGRGPQMTGFKKAVPFGIALNILLYFSFEILSKHVSV